MKTISVIIPMYNTGLFIRQSIQSVINQTYQNLEILVVDDSSTDQGPEICRELCLSDNRIQFHRKEHGGVSAARNYALDLVRGEYVFFLDSDDVIHPLLLEEMVYQMEEHQAGMAVCAYDKIYSLQLEKLMGEISKEDDRPNWKIINGMEVEEYFHIRYCGFMQGIGGKMVRMELMGNLRFDTKLSRGEDTWFLYHLVSNQVRAAVSFEKWYYYRMHADSVTHLTGTIFRDGYFEGRKRIRDSEFRKKNFVYALRWEQEILYALKRNYKRLKEIRDLPGCRIIEEFAEIEMKHPMYSQIEWKERLLFWAYFHCGLLFWMKREYDKWIKLIRTDARVGILTFHCADNFGAMLQAYGLKTFLISNGIQADVIRYDPPYMTGRHWLVPYLPNQWKKLGVRKAIWGILRRLKNNLRMKDVFFARRKNMRLFREKYLIDKRCPRLLFAGRLQRLPYQFYIVGSDQIWNPDITCGLRKAYFGAFKNKNKKKVVSYGASLGGTSLRTEDEEIFSHLLRYVDAISLREEAAVPYVQKFCNRGVEAVLDPVFFLKKKDWRKLEKLPERDSGKGYILVYVTEDNHELIDFVQNLSQERNLSVVEVSSAHLSVGSRKSIDFKAGPSEFLGYIQQAEYVVSNSVHAIAFSIIYEKRFLAFAHRSRNARIYNILKIHGLEDRLCVTGEGMDIDRTVNWEKVRIRTQEAVNRSGDFLINNVTV